VDTEPLVTPGSCPECGASGERAHAGWCEVARAERDPAMAEAEEERYQRSLRAAPGPRSKDPGPSKRQPTRQNGGAKSAKPVAEPDSKPLSADTYADDPLTDAGTPASEEYRMALEEHRAVGSSRALEAVADLSNYQAYLGAISELNAARLALVVVQKRLVYRKAALEEAVAVLGADPLEALGKPRRPTAAGQRGGRIGRPGWVQEEVMALLPGRVSEIARAGGLSPKSVSNALRRAEEKGLVRREYTDEVTNAGRRISIWHRVEDGGPA
jgi:DNA-binding transcriptional ArsR family regulator